MSDRSAVGIERLFEADAPERIPLPDERVVFANFVTSIDGVAAIRGVPRSSAIISGGAPADRFVMGLLRAVADAVVVGSGTLREHEGPWTAERAFPDAAAPFAEARRALGLSDRPALVVVSRGGDLPSDHPVLADAIVVTTTAGARNLAERAVRPREVIGTPDGADLDPPRIVAALRERGLERILTEGGPRLMGSMLAAAVVDELFLTVSPRLLGGGPERPPLTEGARLDGVDSSARIVSARRAGDHLLLRYRIRGRSEVAAPA